MQEDPKDYQLIQSAPEFDAQWYRSTYRDVSLLNYDPVQHFLVYGADMGRDPGPRFDSKFYRKTYPDATASRNPLLAHISSLNKNRRFTNPIELHDLINSLTKNFEEARPKNLARALRRPMISYCIPLKGRLDDIKGTLRQNLDDNRRYNEEVEFLIVEFSDGEGSAREWVEEQFSDELGSGFLRIEDSPNFLDTWHFGKAKNAFRDYMLGGVYSSLDGDNFVTAEETQNLIDIASRYPNGFVFHHFSGEWGDGTSGRVSLPGWMYYSVGYDDTMLPRQFDEMDLIIACLKRYPHAPFISVSDDKNAFSLSKFLSDFAESEKLDNRRVFLGDCWRRPPLNPRGFNYAKKSPYLDDMNNFNACRSLLRHSEQSSSKEFYERELRRHKFRLIESMPHEVILPTFFDIGHLTRDVPKVSSEDICLFACVRNEERFLSKFINHYRNLGIAHFFLIDDHSTVPIESLDLGSNVYSFVPKVGDFRTSKTLWIESLMKVFLPENNWALTVDADEFLHLPKEIDSLRSLVETLEHQEKDFVAAILIDMVPPIGTSLKQLRDTDTDFLDICTALCYFTNPIDDVYQEHHSIRWGFGRFSHLSWLFDVRHHVFGTFDSLRKLPLFRYRYDRHLNQGYHDLHFLEKSHSMGSDIWSTSMILPLFHYKLGRVFSEEARANMMKISSSYHERTGQNIKHIFQNDSESFLTKLGALSRFLIDSSDAWKTGLLDFADLYKD